MFCTVKIVSRHVADVLIAEMTVWLRECGVAHLKVARSRWKKRMAVEKDDGAAAQVARLARRCREQGRQCRARNWRVFRCGFDADGAAIALGPRAGTMAHDDVEESGRVGIVARRAKSRERSRAVPRQGGHARQLPPARDRVRLDAVVVVVRVVVFCRFCDRGVLRVFRVRLWRDAAGQHQFLVSRGLMLDKPLRQRFFRWWIVGPLRPS